MSDNFYTGDVETWHDFLLCAFSIFTEKKKKKERMRSAPGACKFRSPLTYCIVHWGCYVFLFVHYSFRLWGNLYSVFDAIALFGWSGFQADDSRGQWCLVYLKPVAYTMNFYESNDLEKSSESVWIFYLVYYKNEIYVFISRCKQCIIN